MSNQGEVDALLENIKAEDIHKRIANSKMHTLRQQMVLDIQKIRKINNPLLNELLEDISKPIVYSDPRLLHFYGGMFCMLNLLFDKQKNYQQAVFGPMN